MYGFPSTEFALVGEDKLIHLGGLLAEMEPEPDGDASDPGAGQSFAGAIQRILAPDFKSRWGRAGT